MNKDYIYKLRGELAVLERELEELEISGSNSLITINNLLDPRNINESILDLKIIPAQVEMKQLSSAYEKASGIKAKMEKISSMLNEIEGALR